MSRAQPMAAFERVWNYEHANASGPGWRAIAAQHEPGWRGPTAPMTPAQKRRQLSKFRHALIRAGQPVQPAASASAQPSFRLTAEQVQRGQLPKIIAASPPAEQAQKRAGWRRAVRFGRPASRHNPRLKIGKNGL